MDVELFPEARLDPFRCNVSDCSVRFALILVGSLPSIAFHCEFPDGLATGLRILTVHVVVPCRNPSCAVCNPYQLPGPRYARYDNHPLPS